MRSRGVLAALAALPAVACDVILGAHFDGLRHGDPDASTSVCGSAGLPQKRTSDVSSGGSLSFVLAGRAIAFGDLPSADGRPGYLTVGFDLDNTCTGEGQGPSCVEPPGVDATDGDQGRDNALARLWASFVEAGVAPDGGPIGGSSPYTVVARVSDYNGEADDDRVTIEYFLGTGVAPDAQGNRTPRWDGTDRWDVASFELQTDDAGEPRLDGSPLIDPVAYVAGWNLVSRLTSFPLASPSQAPRLAADYIWTGRLAKEGGGWAIHDGVQSSRLPVSELLASLGGYDDVLDPNHRALCRGTAEYAALKAKICSFVDIATLQGDRSRPCDALSNGSTFEASPAILGGIDPTELPANRCPSVPDPASDSCDAP